MRPRFRGSGRATSAILGFFVVSVLAVPSCSEPPDPRPNILWIVWDTARADHLGLYGHDRPTTPNLERWAQGARVFDDCLSTAGYTLPSHASMFTGLMPSEHCAHNDNKRLEDRYTTIAELLQAAGYRTYLYSANPHISTLGNFTQGFDLAEHPWSDKYRDRAIAIIQSKLPEEDRSSELRDRFRAAALGQVPLIEWNIKAAGALAREALLSWLGSSEPDRPYFAFLNYMEAHRPYIPARDYRERMMSPEEVAGSYEVDRSWLPMWEYTFGLRDYTAEEIALTRATYDATLAELDDLFAELIEGLEAGGHLHNTIVVLTSDHGEHLGEQHMLDHQYSVYQPLLQVPLVLYYPGVIVPGHETRPVMNFDIFPTLLELTGVDPPAGLDSKAISLLRPPDDRVRFAEEPAFSKLGVRVVQDAHPDWDPSPWQRTLRSLVDGDRKLIRGSDGRRELFDLGEDPLETSDLADRGSDDAAEMDELLEAFFASLADCDPGGAQYENLSPEQRELLKSLGYVD